MRRHGKLQTVSMYSNNGCTFCKDYFTTQILLNMGQFTPLIADFASFDTYRPVYSLKCRFCFIQAFYSIECRFCFIQPFYSIKCRFCFIQAILSHKMQILLRTGHVFSSSMWISKVVCNFPMQKKIFSVIFHEPSAVFHWIRGLSAIFQWFVVFQPPFSAVFQDRFSAEVRFPTELNDMNCCYFE